jgi:hypothetical protein
MGAAEMLSGRGPYRDARTARLILHAIGETHSRTAGASPVPP